MDKTNRIFQFDNLKAFLILLVVIGHANDQYISQSHALKALWIFCYSFHMPLFLFSAGLMHKGYKVEDKLNRYRVASLLICGFTLKTMIGLVKMLLAGGGKISFKLLGGGGVPWFVMVLAAYELIAYFVRGMKPGIVITGAVLLSIFVGYDKSIGDFLNLSRLVVFLPFYMFGYYLDPKLVTKWTSNRYVKVLSLAVLLGWIAVCFVKTDWIYQYRGLFTGRNSFETVAKKLPDVSGLSRIFTTSVTVIVGSAVVALMPNKKIGLVSHVGQKTMQIYFWHKPILYVLTWLQLYEKSCLFFGMEIGKIVYVLSAVAVTVLCSLPLFSHPTDEILKIRQQNANDAGR